MVCTGVPQPDQTLEALAAEVYREVLWMQDPPDWPDASEEEIAFFLARNNATIARRVRSARRMTVVMRVDDRPLPFLRVGDEGAWAASAHVPCEDGESYVQVTVRYLGEGTDAVALARVVDLMALARDDD
jgi:hypothetical protein